MKKGAVKTSKKAAMAQQSPACGDDYAREAAHHAGTGMIVMSSCTSRVQF